jgi:hypothetical protein
VAAVKFEGPAHLSLSGRGRAGAADAWRRRELARIPGRLTPAGQAAVTAAPGLPVRAPGDDYGLAAHCPVPL